jgi:ABC-type branched-subunit amino acid transport system permease subunit
VSGRAWRRAGEPWTGAGLVAAFGAAAALSGDVTIMAVAVVSLLAAIAALAYNLLIGYAGQLSFGHAGFYAIGAYAAAMLAARTRLSFAVVLVVAMAPAMLIGVVVGLPSLKIRGLFLALATLAFAEITRLLAGNFEVTGGWTGIAGIPAPDLFGHAIGASAYLGVVTALTVVAILACFNLTRSNVGRGLIAIKSNEDFAASVGIEPWRAKLTVFVFSSCLVGLAGVLSAYYLRYVGPDLFTVGYTVQILAVAAVTRFVGLASVVPFAVLLVGFPEIAFRDYPQLVDFVYAGLLLVAIMVPEIVERRRSARA